MVTTPAELFALMRDYLQRGDFAQAEQCGRQYLQDQPAHAEGHVNLGICLANQQRLEEAIHHFAEAVRLEPTLAQARLNLGVALVGLGKLKEAEAALREAVRLRPDYAEGYYNLGNTLATMDQHEEALAVYRKAIEVRPDYFDAYNNLGLGLTEQGRLAEAEIMLRQAVRLRPDSDLAHNNLGLVLADQGRVKDAIACYETALRINPRYTEAHANLGNVLKDSGNLEAALASYQVALWLRPDDASTHWNRSLAWLQTGDYQRGWPEYEWRWRRKKSPPRRFAVPQWDGSSLQGRRVLLHSEQGLGDTIQFIRYAAVVERMGGKVTVEAPAFLHRLLASCPGIDRIIPERADPGAVDCHAPLMSLPYHCKTTLASMPADVPYLRVEDGLVESWREKLCGIPGLRVGIVWQGNPHNKDDHRRSVPLRLFEPLGRVPGVSLVSLQRVHGTDQVEQVRSRFRVQELSDGWDEGERTFLDTAAVMKCLDMVVSVDTAAAHLAGALGVRTWVILCACPDWRWLLGRTDSPWYPTARLFRQKKLGEWEPLFADMAGELADLAAGNPTRVLVEVSPGELVDKLTILEIKCRRITDSEKIWHVQSELAILQATFKQTILTSPELMGLKASLESVNEKIWDVEDELRQRERSEEFGSEIVRLARSVYQQNDLRHSLKQQIDRLLGARFGEQKSYSGPVSDSGT